MNSHILRLSLACLWCWATLIPLRVDAIPLWVFAGGGNPPASGGTSPGVANLLAWYDLESNGNDSSVNARNMSNVGSPTFPTGLVGNGLFTDATSEWISMSDATWQHTMVHLSVSLWFKAADGRPTASQYLAGKHEGTTQRTWALVLVTTGVIRFWVSQDGATIPLVDTPVILTDGAQSSYTHVVAVWEASTELRIYINGVLQSPTNTASIPSSLFNSISSMQIANRGDSGSANTFLGNIDSVGIFSDVLMQDEITWLYNSGAGRSFGNL